MSNPTTTQLNTPQAKMATLKAALERSLPNIRDIAAKHLTPERLVKVVLGAASRTPLILDCTPISVVKAVLQAAELGLEPGSSLGEFWLVPFKNGKTGQREVQGIPGYRGLIALARRTGEIANLYAEVVYTKDDFTVELGLEHKLVHKPEYDDDAYGEPQQVKFVYAVAKFKDGSYQFVVLSRKQIEKLRRRSKASDSGPWVTDWEEMAKKTAIRRLAKSLPMSVEMAKAMELQARAEAGNFDEPVVLDGEVIDDTSEQTTTPKRGTGALKAALQAPADATHAPAPLLAAEGGQAGPEGEPCTLEAPESF